MDYQQPEQKRITNPKGLTRWVLGRTEGYHELERSCAGNDGRGMAESLFHGTRPRGGKVIEAIGAEVLEISDGKIKEIRDYHRPVPAKAA
jgi:hypothetical protein